MNPNRKATWLVALSGGCFLAGIFLPAYTIDPTTGSFWLDALLGAIGTSMAPQTKSLVGTVALLLSTPDVGKIILGIVIAAFTIGFPLIKLALLALIIFRGREARFVDWILSHGYWSMLDVFVIAILVLSLTPTLAVTPEPAIYPFTISVFLTWRAHRVLHITRTAHHVA